MEKKGMYNEKVMEHFKNPHSYGKIDDADGIGKVGNMVCGDVMWLYIKVGANEDGEEIIEDIRYETFGCVAAIATSSEITDLAKGKTLEEAIKINKGEIVSELGGLPKIKLHCSVLASDALGEAIYDYLRKKDGEIPEDLEKKHQRIEKEKGSVEARYSEWTDLEKRMHDGN